MNRGKEGRICSYFVKCMKGEDAYLSPHMGKPSRKYVAKGVPGGWRIWNNQSQQYWGQLYEKQPDELVAELNGQKRPEVITELTRRFQKDKR